MCLETGGLVLLQLWHSQSSPTKCIIHERVCHCLSLRVYVPLDEYIPLNANSFIATVKSWSSSVWKKLIKKIV